jgi:hypothetical protein
LLILLKAASEVIKEFLKAAVFWLKKNLQIFVIPNGFQIPVYNIWVPVAFTNTLVE